MDENYEWEAFTVLSDIYFCVFYSKMHLSAALNSFTDSLFIFSSFVIKFYRSFQFGFSYEGLYGNETFEIRKYWIEERKFPSKT